MANDERTTIIVGAGAPLDLDFSEGIMKPSTSNITKAVCKPYQNYLDSNPTSTISLVEDINARLSERFPPQHPLPWSSGGSSSNINFEQIFHVLEMLYSYDRVWQDACKAPRLYPVFAPFVKPDFKDDDFRHLSSVMKQFITTIMEIIGSYDKDFKQNIGRHDWYVRFFKELDIGADIFNFNYDTTIEESVGTYEDGFEKQNDEETFMAFNPKRLLANPDGLTTINHLHGCINYYFESYKDINHDVYTNLLHDLYKYDSYETVLDKMIGRGQSQPTTQSGESYYAAPIITGLRKTDKLNSSPFDFYHTKLVESITNNPKLIIVGYGFGDYYCNQLLERMYALHGAACRIVLIDFWDIPEDMYKWHGGYGLSEELGTFICKMMHNGMFDSAVAELYANKLAKGFFTSNNSCLMAFPKGFKDAAKNIEEIKSFLEIKQKTNTKIFI